MKRWVVALLLFARSGEAAAPLSDVLRAIFPGMDIVATTRHRDDSSTKDGIVYPDAFAGEAIFQVNGPATNDVEQCAAGASTSRELRVRVFDWPRTRADMLAVVQYRFIGATPTFDCPSIGMVVHLSRRGSALQVMERRLVEPDHHWSFAGVALADVTNDGVEELLVEPKLSGGGGVATALQIFDLSGRRLRQILATDSRVDTQGDRYSQTIDLERSRADGGRSVCFELTVFVKNDRTLAKPRVSFECYPTGTGVDDKQAQLLDQRLRPLKAQPHP
jgi:hypothetical protein